MVLIINHQNTTYCRIMKGTLMNKQPEKTVQTMENFIDAFWDIMRKEGMSGLSVSKIAKRAGYNRCTFYAYFTDVYDIVEQAEQMILDTMKEEIYSISAYDFFLDSNRVTTRIVNTLLKYDDKFFLLLSNGGDPQFLKKVQKSAKDFVYKLLGNTDGIDISKDYIVAYTTSAFSGVLSHWYEDGSKDDIHQIVATIQGLIMYGLSGLRKKA